ncbi:30S ribosomal protein S10 [archaeon]|nr:30S ribosomal protein S10 [archaeon]
MAQRVRIKLISPDIRQLEEVCKQIIEIAESEGVSKSGPIPLPTKRFLIVTRRGPRGQGSDTFDKWELRFHRRLIEIHATDRVMRKIIRMKIPDKVQMKIEVT